MCKLFFIFLFSAFSPHILFGQNILDKRVDFSAKDQTLEHVLKNVEVLSGVSFSFSSDVIDKSRRIDISASDASLHEILSSIFSGTAVAFKPIGNQVILYRKKGGTEATPKTYKTPTVHITESSPEDRMVKHIAPEPKPEKQTVLKTVYDTVYVFDTIRTSIIDTQTVSLYDTVIVEKEPLHEKLQGRNTSIPKNEGSFSFSVLVGGGISNFGMSDKEYKNVTGAIPDPKLSASVLNALQVCAGYEYNQLQFGLGWQWSSCNFSYSNDTVSLPEEYETFGSETNVEWTVTVLDSVWKAQGTDSMLVVLKDSTAQVISNPLKRRLDKNNELNDIRIVYLSVPLEISYQLLRNDRFTVSAGAILNFDFAINASGTAYSSAQKAMVPIAGDSFGMNSFRAGPLCQVKYNLGQNVFFQSKAQYLHYITPVATDNQYSIELNSFSVFAGVGIRL